MVGQNIVVIGGTACGPKAAARARRLDQSARITIIEQRDNLSTATCGLPYYISGVIAEEKTLIARQADYFRDVMDITVLTDTRADSMNTSLHTIETTDLKTEHHATLEYDKLVLATGALPTVPNWEGKNLKGIFTLSSLADANAIRGYLARLDKKEVVIVGAGLIGLEMADNFVRAGCNVTVLEALGWPLPALLDADIAVHLEKYLHSKGVKLYFGQRVSGFHGDATGHVREVVAGDKNYRADFVLLSLGVKPNIGLAKEAGLTIGTTGGLLVDGHLVTSNPDIYAGGDCAETINLITGKKTLVPLGSTANKQGRIIGTNLTGGDDTFAGVLGTGIARIFDYNVGRTGLNESQAREAGFDITMALIPATDHSTYYPAAQDILLKVIAEKYTGRLLGGQIVGKGDVDKRTDVLATALTFGAKAVDLAGLDLAYAPPYNSALDPLHNAANVIRNKQTGFARSITAADVKQKLDRGEDFVLLDVRPPEEWLALSIDAKQVLKISLPELRRKISGIPRDKEIITFCRTSIRAYQALRILEGAGFKNVKIMDGSLAAWPYETVSGKSDK
jgi:NADPH-dependent 2,4-dienoyl-CoA reductase/sulfur reductase-like enzyme/rhodanese-related sulfurtransferase